MWFRYITPEENQNKLIDIDTRMVTRGEGVRGGKLCKGVYIYGKGWKLDFGGEHTMEYTDIEL